jgi:hypothetical protein
MSAGSNWMPPVLEPGPDLDAQLAEFAQGIAIQLLDRIERTNVGLPLLMDAIERAIYTEATEENYGSKTRAAAWLGIKRTTLVERLKAKDMLVLRQRVPTVPLESRVTRPLRPPGDRDSEGP